MPRIDKTIARIPKRNEPKQKRSRVLVEAILVAAAELFDEHGYEATTTDRIAERAGVSVGSLYNYFANKDAILTALAFCHVHQLRELAEPCWEYFRRSESPSFARWLHTIVQVSVRSNLRYPNLNRLIFDEFPLVHQMLNKASQPDHEDMVFKGEWIERDPEVEAEHALIAARLVSICAIDLAHLVAAFPPPGHDFLDCEREISRMLLAYLQFGSRVELPEPVTEVPID